MIEAESLLENSEMLLECWVLELGKFLQIERNSSSFLFLNLYLKIQEKRKKQKNFRWH